MKSFTSKKASIIILIFCLFCAKIMGKDVSTLTNPYYVSIKGKAELNTGELIVGKFYYHEPLFGHDDSFYFYPADINSRKIIMIRNVKWAEFLDKDSKPVIFVRKNNKLERSLPNGNIQILSTSILRHL